MLLDHNQLEHLHGKMPACLLLLKQVQGLQLA